MTGFILLLSTGTKIPLSLDDKLLSTADSGQGTTFTANDLANYLFHTWDQTINDKNVDRPTLITQIQFLHLGKRLSAATNLMALDLNISPILHVVIKPADMVRANSSTSTNSKKAKIIKLIHSGATSKGPNKETGYTQDSRFGESSRLNNDHAVVDEEEDANMDVDDSTSKPMTDKQEAVTDSPQDLAKTAPFFENSTDNIALNDATSQSRTAPLTGFVNSTSNDHSPNNSNNNNHGDNIDNRNPVRNTRNAGSSQSSKAGCCLIM